MKKSLILAAALLGASFGASAAGTVFTLENNAGGEIRLTDAVGTCPGASMHAYTTGGSNSGCWFFNDTDDVVTIEWRGGRTVVIEGARFHPTPYGREKWGADSKAAKDAAAATQ